MSQYFINPNARSMSLAEITECAEPVVHLDRDWLEAITKWTTDPDMVLILTGEPLETALGQVKEGYSPRMACAQMVLRYLRELSDYNGGHWLLTDSKMKCEIVDRKLWVWHK